MALLTQLSRNAGVRIVSSQVMRYVNINVCLILNFCISLQFDTAGFDIILKLIVLLRLI